MHGRLKVKTSAEQQEEKRQERAKKLKLFQTGYKKAMEKRENREYDDEALSIVSGLLQANPDLYTLWNFRKEILLHLRDIRSKEEFQAQCQEEMILTEACLRKNTKSYGAWYHRRWIIELTPEPNWLREIGLCNKFLELDERNFHCWNHRRIICQLAQVSPKEELDFTMTKIEANFSNYSAWHYRSSLLPLVHPGPKEEYKSVKEDVILKEYEHIQNAAFTDPSDQSAWFYHRWLLGRAEKNLDILFVHACPLRNFAIVALTKATLLDKSCVLSLVVDDKVINTQWININEPYASTLYVLKDSSFSIPLNSVIKINLNVNGINSSVQLLLDAETLLWKCPSRKQLYISELSAAASQVLKQELESCTQLMELEPDNKWTILTNVLLMQALDNENYEPLVMEYLEKLSLVDPTRQNYYNDLRCKYIVENLIEKMGPCNYELNLSERNLYSIPHLDHLAFIRILDLSKNKITSLKGFNRLICVESLNLSENHLKSCQGLRKMLYLADLDLSGNLIQDESDLEDLKTCSNLKSLSITNNPISLDNNVNYLSALLSKVNLR